MNLFLFLEELAYKEKIVRVGDKPIGVSSKVKCDLDKGTISLGLCVFFKNRGTVDVDLTVDGVVYNPSKFNLFNEEFNSIDKTICSLASEYYNSTDYKNSRLKSKYFKCKSQEDRSFVESITGKDRDQARIRLESFILFQIALGNLVWENENHFYRKLDNCYLFKRWFTTQ